MSIKYDIVLHVKNSDNDNRTEKRKIGDLGEDIALQFLVGKGYTLIERNYSQKWGEIDLICEKDGTVRFVEVKTVSRERGHADGSRENIYRPEELVDDRKLKKLARTAALYMELKHDSREYQIDVVGVILDHETRTAHCRLFEQVLEDNL